jgi:salicylate hydroxylase
LPRETLRVNKKVDSIESTSDGVSTTFHDGQVEIFDAIIGADGIFSTVRRYVVPSGKWTGTLSGFWDCRNLIPYDRAKATLGDEYLS